MADCGNMLWILPLTDAQQAPRCAPEQQMGLTFQPAELSKNCTHNIEIKTEVWMNPTGEQIKIHYYLIKFCLKF